MEKTAGRIFIYVLYTNWCSVFRLYDGGETMGTDRKRSASWSFCLVLHVIIDIYTVLLLAWRNRFCRNLWRYFVALERSCICGAGSEIGDRSAIFSGLKPKTVQWHNLFFFISCCFIFMEDHKICIVQIYCYSCEYFLLSFFFWKYVVFFFCWFIL